MEKEQMDRYVRRFRLMDLKKEGAEKSAGNMAE